MDDAVEQRLQQLRAIHETGDLNLIADPVIRARVARELDEWRASLPPVAPKYPTIPLGPAMAQLLGSLCVAAGVSGPEFQRWYQEAAERDAGRAQPEAQPRKPKPAGLRLVRGEPE